MYKYIYIEDKENIIQINNYTRVKYYETSILDTPRVKILLKEKKLNVYSL